MMSRGVTVGHVTSDSASGRAATSHDVRATEYAGDVTQNKSDATQTRRSKVTGIEPEPPPPPPKKKILEQKDDFFFLACKAFMNFTQTARADTEAGPA